MESGKVSFPYHRRFWVTSLPEHNIRRPGRLATERRDFFYISLHTRRHTHTHRQTPALLSIPNDVFFRWFDIRLAKYSRNSYFVICTTLSKVGPFSHFSFLLLIARLFVFFLRSGTDFVSLLIFFLLLGRPLQKAYGSVVSTQIWIKFGRIVLQVNMHRLTESDFWYDVKLSRW